MEFVAGDVVQLKSGGPRMTVESVRENRGEEEGVQCIWFEQVGQSQELKRQVFPAVVLKRYQTPYASVGSFRR